MSSWPEAESFGVLNAALAELIELEPGLREPRLQAWCAQHPELASRLRQLLASADSEAESTDFTASLQRVVAASLLRAGSTAGAGEQLADWTLQEWRGRGGMAEVWLAHGSGAHRDQRAAIKRPIPGRTSPPALASFERERALLATLDDPRIARLIGAGSDAQGHPWLAMEYVDGERIDHWCVSQGLDIRARIRLLREVALAVHGAHRKLVVHGDIKPSNVLVTANGDIKLLDFGIAQLLVAEPGERAEGLTPQYASPEQLQGLPITPASDVYQLGLMLRDTLTGMRPASGGDLDAIALRALASEPAQRYDSALQLAEDLEAWLACRPVRARLPSLRYRLGRWVARNALASFIGVVLFGVMMAYASTSLIQAQRLRREAQINLEVRDYLIQLLRQTDPMYSGEAQPTTQLLLERSLTHARTELAGQPDLLAELLTIGADTLIRRGDFARSADLLREALDLPTQADGIRRSGLLARHGQALHYIARYAEAEHSLREAESHWYAAGTPGNPLIPLALADVLHSRGDYAGAIDVLERAGRLELNPFARAAWQRDLGTLRRDAGEIHTARPLLEQSLATMTSQYPQDHASMAAGQLALARLEVTVGNVAQARALAAPALLVLQRIYGEHHAVLGMARHALALADFSEQRFAAADELLTAIIERDYATVASGNVLRAYAQLDRAWTRLALGRDADASSDVTLAESTLRGVSLTGHPRWAECQLARAVLALHAADPETARSLVDTAISARTAAFGDTHPLTLEARLWQQALVNSSPVAPANTLAAQRLRLLLRAMQIPL